DQDAALRIGADAVFVLIDGIAADVAADLAAALGAALRLVAAVGRGGGVFQAREDFRATGKVRPVDLGDAGSLRGRQAGALRHLAATFRRQVGEPGWGFACRFGNPLAIAGEPFVLEILAHPLRRRARVAITAGAQASLSCLALLILLPCIGNGNGRGRRCGRGATETLDHALHVVAHGTACDLTYPRSVRPVDY